MRALLIHAYSRQNAGDGLLVDLSHSLMTRAWGQALETRVVALDAASFAGLDGVRPLFSSASGGLRLGAAGVRLLMGTGPDARALKADMEWADVIVAVGGGYLRAGRFIERVKTMLVHLPQLRAAMRSNVPVIYLPQSVGPLRGLVGRQIAKELRKGLLVFLRDDRSVAELGGPSDVVMRIPDLAVLEMAENERAGAESPTPARLPAVVGIVARRLGHGKSYRERMARLCRLLERPVWLVQSQGRGNDDEAFYSGMGVVAQGPLLEALSARQVSAVVSVRLHGALQSLLAGVPAVHLSYERKGFGAYEDLGLRPWVHNATTFDPIVVAAQADRLVEDPSDFAQALENSRERLARLAETLEASLRNVVL